MAILLLCIHLLAGNTSYYVTTNNDTVWGTGIWPTPGFDGQTSIMFVDVDSNLLELKPDTVTFVVILKSGYREVFKSTKTDMWGQLFLHQVLIGDVAVLWGYDFITGSSPSSTSWNNTTSNTNGVLPAVSISHDNVSKLLMADPYPTYTRSIGFAGFMYYLQKDNRKVTHLYDINFKKQMRKYFEGNNEVLEKLQSGKLKYSNMGTFLGSYYYAIEDKGKY